MYILVNSWQLHRKMAFLYVICLHYLGISVYFIAVNSIIIEFWRSYGFSSNSISVISFSFVILNMKKSRKVTEIRTESVVRTILVITLVFCNNSQLLILVLADCMLNANMNVLHVALSDSKFSEKNSIF